MNLNIFKHTRKVVVVSSLFFLALVAQAETLDSGSADDRPKLESFTSYEDFQKALKLWQDNRLEKQGELPSQRGALSEVDIDKLHNAFKPRTIYVKPEIKKQVVKKENLDSAIHQAPKLSAEEAGQVSLSSNPDLQASDNGNLSATAIAGALGATAAGGNAPVVQSKLQGNVDSQSALNNVANQERGQQNTSLPTNNAFMMTTAEGSASLPGSSAVNIVQRTTMSSSMPTLH